MGNPKVNNRRNIDIVPETWVKVGVLSAEQGTTKRDIVEKAIEFYYDEQKRNGVKQK